jgi:hypothetical protein
MFVDDEQRGFGVAATSFPRRFIARGPSHTDRTDVSSGGVWDTQFGPAPRTAAHRGPKRTTTVASSVASAPIKSRSNCCAIGQPFSLRIFSEKATS